jgi:bla regulator protein BlaR1
MIPGYLSPLVNHLWQSTLFAAVAALLTLSLRKNRAAVRYGLWLAASVKFLVPFSWLVAVGSRFEWRTTPAMVSTGLSVAMEQVLVPQGFMAAAASSAGTSAPAVSSLAVVLFGVWALGVAAVLFSWWRQWRPIRAALSRATPLRLEAQHLMANVDVLSSPDLLEPGIVGIRRPVLLLPQGIADRLPPSQLRAILAHECCHVRRRDNLAAGIHMLVEALYWFHPLVWWIETRLVDERERACDEDVLRMGSAPDAHAEGILSVCRFYVESQLVCTSGVTGSDLKRRIEAIMDHRAGHPLTIWKTLILVTTAVMAVAAPVVVGVMHAPPLRAQSQAAADDRPAFEVASVKPNTSHGPSGLDFAAGGRLTARNMSLRTLIWIAYRIQDFQLSGGPDLLNDRFDIVAKSEGNLPVNELQLRLRTLLGDRFGLTVHSETRELPVYALVMARSDGKMGAQLRRSGDSCAPITAPAGAPPPPPPPPGSAALPGPAADADPNRIGQGCGGMFIPGRLSGRKMTMTQVANTLSRFLKRAVIERTGLTGNFDLDLAYTPDQMPVSGPEGFPLPAALAPSSEDPSIFTAVQEQLGLKLQSTEGPVQVLVIDHVQRPSDDQAAVSPAAAP